MSELTHHVPNHASGLEPSAFHAQLRRLESLQTLMSQGGVVVAEVAQFVIKAREELSAFEREQLCCVTAQQGLMTEREQLSVRVHSLETSLAHAELVAHEQEVVITRLRSEIASQKSTQDLERSSVEQAATAQAEDRAQARIRELLDEVERTRATGERKTERAREEAAALVAGEIALLKTRISAMEHQLESERKRRVRLMDVVKAHEVHVAAKRVAEIVT